MLYMLRLQTDAYTVYIFSPKYHNVYNSNSYINTGNPQVPIDNKLQDLFTI